jgi:hypothetical protein
MTLAPETWDRLEFLLGKDHVVGINQSEMDEIVEIIKSEYPDNKWTGFKTNKQWIDFGLVIVGARLMIRQARLLQPPETFLHPEKVYADIYDNVRSDTP